MSLKIAVAGDVSFRHPFATEKDYRVALQQIQPIFARADYRIVNLENPVAAQTDAPIPKNGPAIGCRAEDLIFLELLQCDCAILANNHMKDFGEKAVLRTCQALALRKIAYVGGGKNLAEAYLPVYVRQKDVTVALLAVCENEFSVATEDGAGSAGYDLIRLREAILDAKEQADFVMILFHGGNEYCPFPSPQTIKRYRLLCDLGADAVVAMHTHCPQGWEIYRGKPILYSLGNFYFPLLERMRPFSNWFEGYTAELTFTKGEPVTFIVHPYRFDAACTQITPYTGAEREKIDGYYRRLCAIIAEEKDANALYDAWCVTHAYVATRLAQFDETFWEGAQPQALYAIRNLFCCESHLELVRRSLQLMTAGGLVQAHAGEAEILRLQMMDAGE